MAVTAKFQADFANFYSAVQKAEVSLSSFQQNAGRVESSLTRMSNSLSGTKIISQATLMTEAVNRVGGASTLTAREQARVNATVTEGIAKYQALGQTAPKAMTDLAAATQKTGGYFTELGTQIKATMLGFVGAQAIIATVRSIGRALGEFVDVGMKLPAVQRSYESLAAGVNINSHVMLAAMRSATYGMVADFDLMQSANKAVLLGLPVTAEEMGKLAHTATVLGRAMGQDATSSLDDLIKALGRSSPMILDNLGLTVKVGEANEAYAAKLGKTTEQLTEQEKKLAFYEAALIKADEKVRQLGEQTKTLGEIVTTVWTKIGNVVAQVVADLNVSLGAILTKQKSFATFFENVQRVGLSAALAMESLGVAAASAAKPMGDINLNAKDLGGKALPVLSAELPKVAAGIDRTMWVTEGLGDEFANLGEQVGLNVDSLKQITDEAAFFAAQAEGAWVPATEEVTAATKETAASVQGLGVVATIAYGDLISGAQAAAGAVRRSEAEIAAALRSISDAYFAAGIITHLPIGGLQPIPGFASGVSNFSGGPAIVGERGPELVNLPRGSSVTPNSALGGSTVIVNAPGSFFDTPSGRAKLARAVSDAVDRQLRSRGYSVGRA
uniref:Putative tail protein n=1 Tax=viral metagenome TaxID=1070528 RepID=A0A6M3J714_9ZZZZ